MKKLLVSIFIISVTGSAQAAITNFRMIGVTNTNAILVYTAPTTDPCSIEVSESSNYTPLVHDVDPLLFPGSNMDNREQAFSAVPSVQRLIVIGKRTTALAADGKYYSRALQTVTQQYVRVRCAGAQEATLDFPTATIPLGMTHSDALPLDPNNPGQYLAPTLSANDRTQKIIDPETGVLIRRISMPGDYGPSDLPYAISGFRQPCSATVDVNGFYHCVIGSAGGHAIGAMYGIQPQTGEVRFLGAPTILGQQTPGLQGGYYDGEGQQTVLFDQHDANVWYGNVPDAGGIQERIVKFTYHGNDVPVDPQSGGGLYAAPCLMPDGSLCVTGDILTPSSGLGSLVKAFNPAFDDTIYNCGIVSLDGGYMIMTCLRGAQDTYGWVAAFDVNTRLIVNAIDMMRQPVSHWCTLHATMSLGDAPATLLSPQLNKGFYAAGDGPFHVFLTQAASPTDTTLTVTSTWDPTWGPQPTQWQPGEPVSPHPDHFFDTAAVGDVIMVTGELERITSISHNGNSTTYTVQRALDQDTLTLIGGGGAVPPISLAAGSEVTFRCSVPGDDWLIWKFDSPPQYGIGFHTGSGGHDMGSGNYFVSGGYSIYASGGFTDATYWNKAPIETMSVSPTFAGADPGSYGNSVEDHPTYYQPNAPLAEQSWFSDVRPFDGDSGGTSTPLGGDLYQYHDTLLGPTTIQPKKLDVFGVCGTTPLTNISGPNAQLTGNASDNNKFCIVDRAGECHPGSQSGDIFANCAGITNLSCGELSQGKDICIQPMSMNETAVSQFGIQGSLGSTFNDGLNSLSRVLSNTFMSYRSMGQTATNKVLADGSWILYGYTGQWLMLKPPPWTGSDGIDRSDFIQVPVTIPPTPGATNVVVAFGYTDYGDPRDLNCTSRAESCVKGADAGNDNYHFGTGTATGIDCTNGCTINVPALPGHLVYAQVKYLNASNQVTSQGPLMVAPVDTFSQWYSVTTDLSTIPPYISNVAIENLSPTSVRIRWNTDLITDTQLEYGLDTQYGQTIPVDPTLTQNHVVVLSNLSTNITYHFRIHAQGTTGPAGLSRDYSFAPQFGAPGPVTTAPGSTFNPVVYPNPWRSDKHTGKQMIFDRLIAGGTIKIFTVSGRKVKEIAVTATAMPWDLKNDAGDKVASGIYVYLITDGQGSKAKGKVAVIK